MHNTTPGSALTELFHRKALVQLQMKPWTFCSREGSKPRNQILPMIPSKPSGHPELKSAALPIPDDRSRL